MNERERKLLIVLVAIFVGGAGLKYLYPKVIAPLIGYGKELDQKRALAIRLDAEQAKLEENLTRRYYDFVKRSGGTDPDAIRDELYEQINRLLREARLEATNINPRQVRTDRRTHITTVSIAISARGRFAQCIQFMKGFYELPYIARLDSLELNPTHARNQASHDEVQLRGEIEVEVPPADTVIPVPPHVEQPDKVTKYKLADTTSLEQWRPFNRFIRQPPPPPPVETPKPEPTPTPPPRVATGPPTDPDSNYTILRMTQRYGTDDAMVQEVVLEDMRTQETRYVPLGDDLDGGELVLVHALGALVHKQDSKTDYGYFIYPLGEYLAAGMDWQQASDSPELQAAAWLYLKDRQQRQEAAEQAAAEKAASELASAEETPEGPYVIERTEGSASAEASDVLGPVTSELTSYPFETAPAGAASEAPAAHGAQEPSAAVQPAVPALVQQEGSRPTTEHTTRRPITSRRGRQTLRGQRD